LSEIWPYGSKASLSPSPTPAARRSAGAPPKEAARERLSPEPSPGVAQASVALHNLRGVAVAFVLMTHSSLAYVASAASSGYAFDRAPYQWLAFPILDPSRWLGFDIFCGWQDAYLMALWFFLSGVFTWPSLERNGSKRFLTRRVLKLGGGLLFGLVVVMPVALYPVYRLSASNPSLIGYIHAYRALPFIPNGPMWFLWMLIALNVVAAALHRWARGAVEAAGSLVAAGLASRPALTFAAFAVLAIAAYAPLALAFTPWRWADHGPLAVQFCRPLLYGAYFLLGVVVGRQGLGQGMLNADGFLAKHWRALVVLALAAFALWMGLIGLSLKAGGRAPAALELLTDASFALAGLGSVLLALAAAFRFGTTRRPLLGALADKALPIYLIHYAPVVWMQYALLDLALPAVAKAAIVFISALAISYGLAAGAGLGRSRRRAAILL
jgi:surface polysaccharide O-acyltransferase-like enzyme